MPSTNSHAKAQRHLSRRCPVMRGLIKRVGPCTLVPFPHDPFTLLVRCVMAQQISTKAAQSIFDRLATAAVDSVRRYDYPNCAREILGYLAH